MEGFKNYREEKYKIEIIKEIDDPDECGRAENYIIRNHMQLKDGLCLNRACCCCNGEKVFSYVGRHHSERVRKKMSESHKGTHLPEETKQKISKTLKGRPRSEETRKKISETLQGHPLPRRIKISIKGITFDSLTEAAKYYNVGVSTISRWIKNKKHNSFYVEK